MYQKTLALKAHTIRHFTVLKCVKIHYLINLGISVSFYSVWLKLVISQTIYFNQSLWSLINKNFMVVCIWDMPEAISSNQLPLKVRNQIFTSADWRWSYCSPNKTSRSNLEQSFDLCPFLFYRERTILNVDFHNTLPSFPSGFSLHLICLTLNKQHWPYLLSLQRHFKPNSYSLLQVRSE